MAAGWIASRFAKGLSTIKDKATALAVGSRNLDKARRFAAEHGIQRAYGSYEELLADPDVDAVYISTPNSLHAEWSIKAAQAGKHILCEKPVTVNAREFMEVLQVVKQQNVFFMEAFMYRCHPQWAKVKELIASGAIGEVRLIESTFAFNMGLHLDNIRLSNPLAGGALMDVGCYCVSFSRLAAGSEPIECKAVAHIGKESRVDHYTAGLLKFPSGAVAHFSCATQCNSPAKAAIYGSAGSIYIPVPWFPADGRATLVVESHGKQEKIEFDTGLDLYASEALTVAEYLDKRQAPAMSWEDSLGQMRTLDELRANMGLRFDCEV